MADDPNRLTPGRRRRPAPAAAESNPTLGLETVPPHHAEQQADPGPGAHAVLAHAVVPGPVTATRGPAIDPAAYRRRLLWRDSAAILIVLVVAMLGAQTFLPRQTGEPGSSAAVESGISIGSLPPGVSLPPGATFGPIIDPSLGIDATPTPIPLITLGPPRTAGPSPSPAGSTTPVPSTSPGPSEEPPPAPPSAAFTWDPPVPIVGGLVSFSNTSTGATEWAWTFGDPASGSSSAMSPAYSFADAGTWTVRLTVTGPGGTDYVEHQVTVLPPPGANFTWIESSPCVIDFTNTSTGDTSWDWDFGDSSSSSAQNPTHPFTPTGSYSVTLTINGAGGPAITKSVDVAGPCP